LSAFKDGAEAAVAGAYALGKIFTEIHAALKIE
jgi:hypothetical protein